MIGTAADLPLSRDPASRLLPWIIAFMVYLAALALAAALALSTLTAHWRAGLTGTLTVQILPLADGGDASLDQRTETALALLRKAPGVIRAEALTDQQMDALLRPWLGAGAALRDLPVPRLIDVSIDPQGPADVGRIEAMLAGAVPGSAVDDHAVWLGRLIGLARAVELVAFSVVAVVSLAAIAVVIFTTRTGLSIHHDIVEILHLIGAQDDYLARQFQNHAMVLGFKGGLIGLALAAASLIALMRVAGPVEDTLLPGIGLTVRDWIILGLLPLAAAMIAMLSARRTVMAALRRML